METEQQLQKLFSDPVKFHLLFKATHHHKSTLLDKFDLVGQFVVVAYLASGTVRGAYLSKPPECRNDDDAFLFALTTTTATKIPFKNSGFDKSVTLGNNTITFGDACKIRKERQGEWIVEFSSDALFETGWTKESVDSKGSLKDLELFRVQGEVTYLVLAECRPATYL